jgi:hypothetical protein
MVFSKERFMTKCEVIKANEPKSSFKNNNSTQNKRTVTHKEKLWDYVGVRHKNTTLPKQFTVPKTNTDRIQLGLNVPVGRVRRIKLTLPYHFTVPNTDRTQLIPRISVSI